MSRTTRSSSRFFQKAALVLAGIVALVAAVSPAAAAGPLAEMDRSALAMIIAFGTLLLAMVIEVWRMTLKRQDPVPNPSRRID